MYIVLVYDISLDENGQKVLSRVFKTCKKYLCHVQNSVFEGEASPVQLAKLKSEIEKVIRKDKDSIIIFESRQEKWLKKEFIGMQDDKTSTFL